MELTVHGVAAMSAGIKPGVLAFLRWSFSRVEGLGLGGFDVDDSMTQRVFTWVKTHTHTALGWPD